MVDEVIWKKKSRLHVQKHLENVSLPHRAWLADKILPHVGASQQGQKQVPISILEIGCGCGANLEVLARCSPSIRLTGVDISPQSVAVGRERFKQIGLENITLIEGQADSLRIFADASVDVVFTDAMLLYIGPDKISRVIEEMGRIAKRAVILLELHRDGIGLNGSYTRDGFIRDYRELCKQLSPHISVIRMPSEKRPAGRWPEFGTLTEVILHR